MNEKVMDKITADFLHTLQDYNPTDVEVFKKAVLYGASHHKEINRRSAEWYKKHNASIEEGERNAGAVCEGLKQVTRLGQAVESLKNMKTYEEIRDEVLEKLIHGLQNNPEQRKTFMDVLIKMDEQDEELRKIIESRGIN